MSLRADLRYDGDRCPSCRRLLVDADVRRMVDGDDVDVLAICGHCGQPAVIPWIREAA